LVSTADATACRLTFDLVWISFQFPVEWPRSATTLAFRQTAPHSKFCELSSIIPGIYCSRLRFNGRSDLRITIVLFVCLLATAVTAEQLSLEQHFRGYIGNWRPDADIDAVVAKYWDSRATMHPQSQPPLLLNSPAEIAAALRAVMLPVIAAGWQGSAVVAFSSCRLREDLALVGIAYQRRFLDARTTTDSAVYVVRLTAGVWVIQSVMGTDTHDVSC